MSETKPTQFGLGNIWNWIEYNISKIKFFELFKIKNQLPKQLVFILRINVWD